MNKMNKLMNRKKSYQQLNVRKFAYKSKENLFLYKSVMVINDSTEKKHFNFHPIFHDWESTVPKKSEEEKDKTPAKERENLKNPNQFIVPWQMH